MHDPYDDDDPDELGIGQEDPHRERRRMKYLLKIRRRNLRDAADPFDVTYVAFVKSYRLSQDLVFSVLDLIRPFMRRTNSPLAVPIEQKVCKHCFELRQTYYG